MSVIKVNALQNISGTGNFNFASGTLSVSSGTTASPSINLIGNTNTGIYSPTSGTLGFVTNGVETFRYDSTGVTVTALNGGPISGARNRIINGGMDIWQRGTSFTNVVSGTYAADRFVTTTNGINLTLTQDTSVPNSQFLYSLKAVPASSTTLIEASIRQWIEIQNIIDFPGQTVTASAWVKCSQSSVRFRLGSYNTNPNNIDNIQTISVTPGVWTKISYTFNTFTNVTGWSTTNYSLAGAFYDIGFVPGNTVTTSDYLNITGVQVELGTKATPFERRNITQELLLCQRYFYSTCYSGTSQQLTNQKTNTSGSYSGAFPQIAYFPVQMRAIPTVTTYTNSVRANPGNVQVNGSSVSSSFSSSTSIIGFQTWNSAALTNVGDYYNYYMDVTAEL